MEMNYDQQESGGKKTLWIIGGIILIVMIIALVYGATQKSLKNADTQADSDEQIQLTNTGTNKPSGNTGVLGTSETAAPEDYIELPVTIDKLEVVNLQTFPQKAQANISYGLSGDCAVLNPAAVTVSGKIITVVLSSRAKKDAPCTKNIVQGETVVDLPIEGLSAGKYTIKAGKVSKSLTIVADNKIQYIGDK